MSRLRNCDKIYTEEKTILNALEKYDTMGGEHLDFPINASFIYPMNENLHFITSVVDSYWLELEVFDRARVKHFIRALLSKIEHPRGFNYDYVFFDCPSNFTALSYSVLSCSNLILIPVIPDVFALLDIGLMIDDPRFGTQPWPDPIIAVFMNKDKLYRGNLTIETKRYWMESKVVCDNKCRNGVFIETLDSFIPERVDIKRAIPERYFPHDYEKHFEGLWRNIERVLSQ